MLKTVFSSCPLATVTTIQPELGKIMYADYKQVGMKLHSVKVIWSDYLRCLTEFQKENENM